MTHYILSKIIAQRTAKNLSQHDMASMLKITEDSYSQLESGDIEITIKTLSDILEILDMETSDLFGNRTVGQAVGGNS